MMDKLKNKLVSIVDSTITNVIVSILVAAVFSILPFIKTLFYQCLHGSIPVAFGLVLAITFLLFDTLKRRLFYYTVYLYKNEVKRVYDYYNYTMTFINPEYIICTIKFRFRSTRCSIDCDSFAFKWQGSGYNISAKGINIEKIKNSNGFEEYLLLFPRIIKRNECVDVELDIELYDKNHTAVPEMQFNVNHPTKNLRMELNIPMDIKLDFVTRQCLVGNSDYAVQSESCDLNKRQFVIQKKKPLFLHKYKFTWQLSK